MDAWLRIECYCGHKAVIHLVTEKWLHRDVILPRCRCSVCGRLGAEHMHITNAPDTPGMGRLVEKPRA